MFFLFSCLPGPGEQANEKKHLAQLKKEFSVIICQLLECYEQTRESHLLAMALHFSDIRTHPLLDQAWGRSRQTQEAEQRLLDAAVRYRGSSLNGSCLPAGSERQLCRRAADYIRAADRAQIPAPGLTLAPLDNCDFKQVQKSLSARQVLLKYVMLEDQVLLFFISDREAGYEFLTVTTGQAVAMVNQLAAPLEDFASGRVDYLRIHYDMDLARRLFNILLKRVTDLFPEGSELLIIPDRELFKLPFEALVMGFNRDVQQDDALFSEYQAADYVIQKYAVSYYLTLADFLRAGAGRREHAYTLAAFGQPLVGGAGRIGSLRSHPGGSTIAAIPSTRFEIQSLERIFSGARRRIFLGADFNQRNFSRYAPQARIIHIATHFFSGGADPALSAFLLSCSGDVPSLCDARQILKMRLQAELVILSACETSEKNLMGMKSLEGMTAAFRHSGVNELIASMWPVDEFNSQIVPLFYNEYLQDGRSAPALRNAKLALLGKTIALRDGVRLSLGHPFLWANYVLYHFRRSQPSPPGKTPRKS